MPRFLMTITLLFSSLPISALETFIEGQTGAMTGAFHLSYGVSYANKHNFSFGVGYVPHVSFHEKMFLTSFKYRYQGETLYTFPILGRKHTVRPYVWSIGTLSGYSDSIYHKTPNHIPDNYYVPTARRLLLSFQPSLQLNQQTEAYFSLTMLDVGLINYIRNVNFYAEHYHYAGLEGVLSFGFGLRKRF